MSKKTMSKMIDNDIARLKLKKLERERHLAYIASLGRKPPDNIA